MTTGNYILAILVFVIAAGFFVLGMIILRSLIKEKLNRQIVAAALLSAVIVVASSYIGKPTVLVVNVFVSAVLFFALVGVVIIAGDNFM